MYIHKTERVLKHSNGGITLFMILYALNGILVTMNRINFSTIELFRNQNKCHFRGRCVQTKKKNGERVSKRTTKLNPKYRPLIIYMH